MTVKTEIVRQLGEQAVLLPALLAEALAANDRLKLRLTLLQEAAAQARAPAAVPRSFQTECREVGLTDEAYRDSIAGARLLTEDRMTAPGAGMLIAGLPGDLAAMLAPLDAVGSATFEPLQVRLQALTATLPSVKDDSLTFDEVAAMTSASRGEADSVHLLVMDAHRAVNVLAAETAVETIDGARVHHVEAGDRVRIAAFMAGLNRTAGLAFGHPGLGTTAVRSGARLTIQNDIGTTDAHVLVVHVEGHEVSVTYTDVHRRRARFFLSLFEQERVQWSPLAEKREQGLANDEAFTIVVGRFAAPDDGTLDRFLGFLGSRIVFLIDWNKARRALKSFVGNGAAIRILTWAALNDFGHRAFLELGGSNLVLDVVRRAAGARVPYGVRLDQALGAAESARFLQNVLREACEGLAAGHSVRLVRDEIQTDLANLFDTAEAKALIVLVHHLGITRMLASGIAEALADGRWQEESLSRLARNAKRLEEKADRLTLEAREICEGLSHGDSLRQAVDQIENATDALDECAFQLCLVAKCGPAARFADLGALCDIVIDSIGHLVRAVEAASHLPQGQRVDVADALQAIDAVVMAERAADRAERDAFGGLMAEPCSDARLLVLGLEVAGGLEGATDRLAHAAQSLRDWILEELSA